MWPQGSSLPPVSRRIGLGSLEGLEQNWGELGGPEEGGVSLKPWYPAAGLGSDQV